MSGYYLKYNKGDIVYYKCKGCATKGLELKGKIKSFWKNNKEKGYIVYFSFFGGELHLLEKDIYTKSNSIKKL